MIDRTGPSIIAAYQRSIVFLQSRGFKPLLQRLDNEATGTLQDFLVASDIDFQLAPPHVHQRNAAERAIRTFKNHFIAGLCSTNPDFPLNLWDKMLPQCLITLNLLHRSRIKPQLSAQAHINGAFDFNRTSLAPPGTKVLIHEKPATCGTWPPHAIEGWYLGPAQRHYRCYRVWAWATNSERIADTLAWFPTTVIMPRHSSTDVAIAAAHDLAQALLSPPPSSPLSSITKSQRHQLLQLSAIFLLHTTRPDDIPIPQPLHTITPSPPTPLVHSPFPAPDNTIVNPSGKTGAQIPQLPLGDNSSPWGDNVVCTRSHTVYTAGCAKSLPATYQYKISNPSNKLLVNNILTNN
jgi:hypothetical protein